MNAFGIASECIWYGLKIISNGVQAFLDLNFYIVVFLLNVIDCVTKTIVELALNFFDLFKCYYYDFLTFSNELALGISFIFNILINFISRRVFQVHYVSCCVVEYINLFLLKIKTASYISLHLLSEILSIISYFTTVVFNAILIILQLGPNLLIFLYENIAYYSKQGCGLLNSSLHLMWEYMCLFPFECEKLIFNVPAKSYFGLLLMISLYYGRNKIKRCMIIFINLLTVWCSSLWFHSLPKTIAYIILLYQKWKRYLSLEESENATQVNSASRRFYTKIQIVLRQLHLVTYFLKAPISRVNEELSDYQLQELEKKLHAEKERRICIICHDRERTTLLYPCRHMCMCEECTRTVQAAYQGCPLCRQNILDTLQVYT